MTTDPNTSIVWLKVWCDGSADPDRGRIAWACVSSGVEDHGFARVGSDPQVAFGVDLLRAESFIAEAFALVAGLRLGRRIAEAVEWGPDGAPSVRLHMVSDCQSLIEAVRGRRRPRGMPEPLWERLSAARRQGVVFAHALRVSTPELAFVDKLAHTALNSTKKAAAVARDSALASELMRSLDLAPEEARRFQAVLRGLAPAAAQPGDIPAEFRFQVGRRANGRAFIARTSGAIPTVGGESALPRIANALLAYDMRSGGLDRGIWLRPRPGRIWRFDAVPAPEEAAEPLPVPAP